VLLTLLALRDRGMPLPAAAVCISPWADLSNQSPSRRNPREILLRCNSADQRDTILDQFTMAAVGGDRRKLGCKSCSALSLAASFAGLPPLRVVVGNDEMILDDAVEVARRAREDGVAVTLEVADHMPHVYPTFGRWLPEGDAETLRICRFIQQRTASLAR